MKVLIACEESQAICKAMRDNEYEAYSCGIRECSGGHPEWHIKGDCLEVINGNTGFFTQDGEGHIIEGKWDLLIAHPPCTYLSNAGNQCFSPKLYSDQQIAHRMEQRIEGMQFFLTFVKADCDKIAIKNPIGVTNTAFRKPDQIIDPWMFAESENDEENYVTKKTCLWTKGLPQLVGNPDIEPKVNSERYANGKRKNWTEAFNRDPVKRSKTFPGIARAIADQWAPKGA